MAGDALPLTPLRAAGSSISSAQIEVVISRCVAVAGVVFGGQAIPPIIEQAQGMVILWSVIAYVGIFGGLIAGVVASFMKRGVRAVYGYVVVAWAFAMLTWPIAQIDTSVLHGSRPWLWALLTMATAAAAVAWPLWAAIAVLVAFPVIYAVMRLSPAGGSANLLLTALDVVYAVLLGGAVLILITLLRQAAASVDLAQTTAIDRYSTAVRQHATEVERVAVDAIVHDGVLTTFLSAATAETPQAQALAGRMARDAMGYLRDAALVFPDDTSTTAATELANRIRLAAAGMAARFVIRRSPPPVGEIPVQSAESVYSAAVQAMVNSVQHAGVGIAVKRWISITSRAGGGVVVEVGDTGVGFDPDGVLSARIGLRVSIVERMSNSGGEVEVRSTPGEGTVIRISWPADRPKTRELDLPAISVAGARAVSRPARSPR